MLRAGKAQPMHDEVIGLGSWQGFGCVSCVSIHLHVYYLLIKEPEEQEVPVNKAVWIYSTMQVDRTDRQSELAEALCPREYPSMHKKGRNL